jgi:hypothetical protein
MVDELDPEAAHDAAVDEAIEKVRATLQGHKSCGRCTQMHVAAALIAGAVIVEHMDEMTFVLYMETIRRLAVQKLQATGRPQEPAEANDEIVALALAEAHRSRKH